MHCKNSPTSCSKQGRVPVVPMVVESNEPLVIEATARDDRVHALGVSNTAVPIMAAAVLMLGGWEEGSVSDVRGLEVPQKRDGKLYIVLIRR